MVDYVLRPLAGLLLCGLIGAVLLSLPWFITRLREILAELRGRPRRNRRAAPSDLENAEAGPASD